MPIYAYRCQQGHAFDRYLPMAEFATEQSCECGAVSRKIITAAMIRGDIPGYQSPVDGRWVEGKRARREDLARNNCVPYEPSMKQDHMKRIERSNAAIDAKVDAHVESEIARMPARKREKLEAELRGSDVSVERSSVPAGTKVNITP